MYKQTGQSVKQGGFALLEGLIAILIFSLGVLAVVGMQAVAVKQSTDARYRSDASLLADRLIGTMWATDRAPATLQANFATGEDGYNAWKADVAAALPGVDDNPPTVTISGNGEATITIFWHPPSEPVTDAAHKFVTIAHIM